MSAEWKKNAQDDKSQETWWASVTFHMGYGFLISGPKLVVLFGETVELLEDAALLEEMSFENL